MSGGREWGKKETEERRGDGREKTPFGFHPSDDIKNALLVVHTSLLFAIPLEGVTP